MKHYTDTFGMRKGAEKFPLMVVLAYTYQCNSRCPGCPYRASTIREEHADTPHMPTDIFEKVAKETGYHQATLRITGGGEPFLHPEIIQNMYYAKSHGCRVSIITNGSRSVWPLVDVVDMIEFSVDAGTEEDYAIARPGLSWDYLDINIGSALAKRKTTKLIVSIINQKGIDVEGAAQYWSKKGVDKVQVRKFLTWNRVEDNSADATPYLPPEEKIPCPYPFERLIVDTRGDISYCNAEIAFEHAFANVRDTTIAEAWLGKEFQELRQAHLERRGDDVKMCRECADWKYRTWMHNYWKLAEQDV